MALNTDLKVITEEGNRHKDETNDPLGIFILMLLLRRPVTPISRVDSSDGLVFKFDMVLIILASYS